MNFLKILVLTLNPSRYLRYDRLKPSFFFVFFFNGSNTKHSRVEWVNPFKNNVGSAQKPVNHFTNHRSSHRRCPVKKGVLKNFAIFTGKHLCWSLLLIKSQAFSLATFIRRDSNKVFSCKYYEILRSTLLEEHMRTAASEANILVCIC